VLQRKRRNAAFLTADWPGLTDSSSNRRLSCLAQMAHARIAVSVVVQRGSRKQQTQDKS